MDHPAGDVHDRRRRLRGDLGLRDATTGKTLKRTLSMSGTAPDVSSAEWIVEAPADCDSTGTQCQQLPISNFGTIAFSRAFATTTTGHRGAISDSRWSRTKITLSGNAGSSGPGRGRFAYVSNRGGAVASTLTAGGSAFSVTYSQPDDTGPSGQPSFFGPLR